MFGCDILRRYNGQILSPLCRITASVMAADVDGYRCVYSFMTEIYKSMSRVAISDVIF